ncbi:uncharacterized protein [Bemisia tabaci]|uniref:uncharacterized protein n=1 Tax=Bemisia tabaci TaxID=7038 RepID=UPI003B28CA24
MDITSESPLEVLSRAASMRAVQDNILGLPPSYEEARSLSLKCKESSVNAPAPTGGKWRRERRHKLAPPPDYPTHIHKANLNGESLPLDMSVSRKMRGSPPSYSQSIAAAHRPTVIIASSPSSSPASDAGGMCDPVIDEHFRRSLGKDYSSVFPEKQTNCPSNSSSRISDASGDDSNDVSASSLSVDDHFAKALGETWILLQQQQQAASKLKGAKPEKEELRVKSPSKSLTANKTENFESILPEIQKENSIQDSKSLLRHRTDKVIPP